MHIHFDDLNLRAKMVGQANGLTPEEISLHSPKALEALNGFRKISEAGAQGFPHLPFQTQVAEDILGFAEEVRGSFDTLCLVGIGGSALGAWALDCGLRGPHPVQPAFSARNPRLVILDNVDPAFTAAALNSMSPEKTFTVVVAKSGSTAETVATFLIVRDWMGRKPGRQARNRIAAVTTAAPAISMHWPRPRATLSSPSQRTSAAGSVCCPRSACCPPRSSAWTSAAY